MGRQLLNRIIIDGEQETFKKHTKKRPINVNICYKED